MTRTPPFDIAIIGAGAAGLMAAIWAGRTAAAKRSPRSIILLDGAKKVGAKILVAGGGRCNVTHDTVDERAYAGSTPHAIRKVLRRFDVPDTIDFFRALHVELKREETGKLFPTTDRAQTVLDTLLHATRNANVNLRNPWRVREVARDPQHSSFILRGEQGELSARALVLATGGMSLPKTGSDGQGYHFARALGHSTTQRIFPALVPLLVAEGHYIRALSGITLPATLAVHRPTGKKIIEFTDSTLCTHFGLSGPSALDISRHLIDAQLDDPAAHLIVNWLPGESPESLDRILLASPRSTSLAALRPRLPERLIRALCAQARTNPAAPIASLSREARRGLVHAITHGPIATTGNRGYTHAEVTAGGVPLSELRLETMESRFTPGLYIIGEMCDVDGRIGGYNFQWAWSSGYIAGISAAAAG